MLIFLTALFCTFLSFSLPAQTTPQATDAPFIKLKTKFDLADPREKILAHHLIDGDKKLWVLGTNTVQLWDLENNKVIYSKRHGVEYLYPAMIGDISPDGTKLLMLSRSVDGQRVKNVATIPPDLIVTGKNRDLPYEKAAIWDMNTGTKIKLFDDLVFNGYWSKNGNTLLVTDKSLREMTINGKPFLTGTVERPITNTAKYQFYNGRTLKKQGSLEFPIADRTFLSADGQYLYATSDMHRTLPKRSQDDYSRAEVFSIWSTMRGEIVKRVPLGGDFPAVSWKLYTQSGARYLTTIAKDKNDSQQLINWEMNGSAAPKFRIDLTKPAKDSMVLFSPDEKLFAIDTGDNAQIYDAETGQLKSELKNAMQPAYWLDDNRIVFDRYAKRFVALDTSGGNFLYEQPLISVHDGVSYGSSWDGSDLTEDVIVDETRIVPHPDGKIFLAFSNRQAQLYDARKGDLIFNLYQKPFPAGKIKKSEQEKQYVADGTWSADGKRLVLVEGEARAISVWDLN